MEIMSCNPLTGSWITLKIKTSFAHLEEDIDKDEAEPLMNEFLEVVYDLAKFAGISKEDLIEKIKKEL